MKNKILLFLTKSRICILLICLSVGMEAKSCHPNTDSTLLTHKVRLPKVTNNEAPPLLLLLHGLGSNEDDLFALADYIPDAFLVISVRAPYTMGAGKYQWYGIDFSKGQPVHDTIQAAKSCDSLLQFLHLIQKKYSFNAQKIYCGGFSQGAIMSLSLGLTYPHKIKGVIALSGRILDEVAQKALADTSKYSQLNALILHGTKDQILPIAYARQCNDILKKLKINTSYKELDIGHTTNEEMIVSMLKWLAQQE